MRQIKHVGGSNHRAVSILAAEVDHALKGHFSALEEVASRVDSTLLNRPAALQTLLEEHAILQRLFNGGVNYIDRDDVLSALKEGKATIGKPHLAKRQRNPEFGMAVPIRDAQGYGIARPMPAALFPAWVSASAP